MRSRTGGRRRSPVLCLWTTLEGTAVSTEKTLRPHSEWWQPEVISVSSTWALQSCWDVVRWAVGSTLSVTTTCSSTRQCSATSREWQSAVRLSCGPTPVCRRVQYTLSSRLWFCIDPCLLVVCPLGSSPSPRLSVSNRLLSPDDSVEVTCFPPLHYVSSCQFYRDRVIITTGSCSMNLTGKQLAIWEKSTTLLPVNMTCTYDPHDHLDIRSEPSNHHMLFVVGKKQSGSFTSFGSVLWFKNAFLCYESEQEVL